MKSFKEFIKEDNDDGFIYYLNEGGNAVINGYTATYIDLEKFNRKEVSDDVYEAIHKINDAFKKETGIPLWSDKLLKKRTFMSGSSLTFFDVSIADDEYSKYKKKVGDIDLQVDHLMADKIRAFLRKSEGKKFGKSVLVGVKSALADTDISIFRFDKYDLNIQLDFEYVPYGVDGFPTEWSMFSRSSAWADMKKGIKGVAHKLLMRAMTYPKSETFIKAKNTPRGKDKQMTDHLFAFSVAKGLRAKYQPVLDEKGKQLYQNGLPVYKALSTKESDYKMSLDTIFQMYFGTEPKGNDRELLKSFTGLIELAKKYYSPGQHDKVIDGFANNLWNSRSGAQGLYRGDPKRDHAEKHVMFNHLLAELGGSIKPYQSMIDTFYKNYK